MAGQYALARRLLPGQPWSMQLLILQQANAAAHIFVVKPPSMA
jgi:hypothetical protein